MYKRRETPIKGALFFGYWLLHLLLSVIWEVILSPNVVTSFSCPLLPIFIFISPCFWCHGLKKWWCVLRQFVCSVRNDWGKAEQLLSPSLLFIFPVCDLRWLLVMETSLYGPQNTALCKSPCLSTSLTCWAQGIRSLGRFQWCVCGGGQRQCAKHTKRFVNLGKTFE